jgi:predicted AAA+ superfamily ATPase
MIEKYIKRKLYIDRLKPYIGKSVIKVIVGQRRVGKSFLLFQIMDELIVRGYKKENIVCINKEKLEFDHIRDYKDLVLHVRNQAKKNKIKAIFIDEIQDIALFEKALRHWHAGGKYDVYCTGSNANLLAGELATYLSGRFIKLEVFSLSYLEFLDFHKLQSGKESLLKYIRYGGLPYLINLELNDLVVFDYLKNIYSTIVLKDIVVRFGVRNVVFLEKLIEYLADNIGSLVSAKKISDFLKSQKIKISSQVVLNYLSNLVAAFIVFKVSRADIRGKKIFEINEKYYFEDLGLRNSLIGYSLDDIGKVLENLVYMHLRINGYIVFVGQLGEKEIDFVAEKNGEKIYIQVAYLITNEATRKREFGNLLAIGDNYRKIVVSMDDIAGGKYKGIEHVNIIDFLSKNI